MLGSIKALVVVLAIGALVFHLATPIALRFMSAEDFSRRRRVWFVLTVVSFVSPNFWLYAVVAVPVLLWANRNDSNPMALYLLLLHVIPPVNVIIPILGNNGLFPIDNYRLLAFCVLLPTAIRFRRSPAARTSVFGAMDVVLLAFGILQIALYTPPDLPHHFVIPDSPSNVLRRAVLFSLDVYLLYFTVTRTCQSRQKMIDAVASFCLAVSVMAAIAVFEHARGWLLYVNISSSWGYDPNASFYLTRGGSLRSQVSSGHALAMGYLLAVAFGLWLYLKSHVQGAARRIGIIVLLWSGLFATVSRGSWLGAIVIYCTFLAAGPRALSRLVKGLVLALAVAGLVAVSPLGERILDVLPVMGKTADGNILYRQRLAERGWELVFAHPFFGDRFPWPEMEDLRQGEGIIDLVNTYLGVALNYGLVGLALFWAFILIATIHAYVQSRNLARSDPDMAVFGASLVACIAGVLVMIQSASFGLGFQKMFYVLTGLAAAYARLSRPSQQRSGDGVVIPTVQRG
jgi:O-antigen ligase